MLQRGEQEGAKSAFAAVHGAEVILFQQAGEEFLSQILSVMRLVAAPANKRVRWPPIRAAERFQSAICLFGFAFAPGQHHAPMSGREHRLLIVFSYPLIKPL